MLEHQKSLTTQIKTQRKKGMQKMKSKKLLVMVLVLLAGSIAFAQYTEGVDFVQYTGKDFNTYSTSQRITTLWSGATQDNNWSESDMITLNVKAGSTVYLTNYVSNFNLVGDSPIKDLGDSSYAEGYNMTANHYGYVIADKGENGNLIDNGNGSYSIKPGSEIHWGTGEQIEVTYYNADHTASQTTAGYKLGTFNEDTEIFFVMTPNGYNTAVNSYDYVDWPNGGENAVSSILQSRHVNPLDQVGNARVNFGIVGHENGHEFVIGSVASVEPPPSGQPLPGVLSSCLIALGATGIAARRRKKSRK